MTHPSDDWITGELPQIDESKLDLRPAIVKVRVPTSPNDPHVLKMKFEDLKVALQREIAAHQVTRAKLVVAERYIQDLAVMIYNAPVGPAEDYHHDDEIDRKARFLEYAE